MKLRESLVKGAVSELLDYFSPIGVSDLASEVSDVVRMIAVTSKYIEDAKHLISPVSPGSVRISTKCSSPSIEDCIDSISCTMPSSTELDALMYHMKKVSNLLIKISLSGMLDEEHYSTK